MCAYDRRLFHRTYPCIDINSLMDCTKTGIRCSNCPIGLQVYNMSIRGELRNIIYRRLEIG